MNGQVDAAAKGEEILLLLSAPLPSLCFRRVQLPHGRHDFQAADLVLLVHHLLPHHDHRHLVLDVTMVGPQVGKN